MFLSKCVELGRKLVTVNYSDDRGRHQSFETVLDAKILQSDVGGYDRKAGNTERSFHFGYLRDDLILQCHLHRTSKLCLLFESHYKLSTF